MKIGVTESRQRNVAVSSSGKPRDDLEQGEVARRSPSALLSSSQPVIRSPLNDPSDNKYRKRRRRKQASTSANEKRAQLLGLVIGFFSIFMLARYVTYGRRDRQMRYARAQIIIQEAKESNTRHKNRRRGDNDPINFDDDDKVPSVTSQDLEREFVVNSAAGDSSHLILDILKNWKEKLNEEIIQNIKGGVRWIRPLLLPGNVLDMEKPKTKAFLNKEKRQHQHMKWQDEYDELLAKHGGSVDNLPGPAVDYTDPTKYRYPDLLNEPPSEGGYPKLTPLGDLMKAWDQDSDNEDIIAETLMHFNFSDPVQLASAKKFRDAMVPFKLYDVPEVSRARELWTDDYVNAGLDDVFQKHCEESPNHYFAFYNVKLWDSAKMGLPPYQINDWDYLTWSKHAHFADATSLAEDQPHFYFQAGISREEREDPIEEQSFVSRDLASFSSTEPNFILFNPDDQKGIQCRFGEKGVVAATHYDSGRNMVAMITGAKRYILSPPKACGKLGIVPDTRHPIYRHSLIDFGHIKYLDDPDMSDGMPDEEREWLERAATAPAVETVLKAGEILYIPSFWFHYIISVQKSAQCNVRSGIETEMHKEFGGKQDVEGDACRP